MKYYIIAGEASGDLHGAGLITAILQADPQAEFRFWGGDLMLKACQGQGFFGQTLPNFSIYGDWASAQKPIRYFSEFFRL